MMDTLTRTQGTSETQVDRGTRAQQLSAALGPGPDGLVTQETPEKSLERVQRQPCWTIR